MFLWFRVCFEKRSIERFIGSALSFLSVTADGGGSRGFALAIRAVARTVCSLILLPVIPVGSGFAGLAAVPSDSHIDSILCGFATE